MSTTIAISMWVNKIQQLNIFLILLAAIQCRYLYLMKQQRKPNNT